MPRVATKITPLERGGWSARKVIPRDVRDDYARTYGQRTEERFHSGDVPILAARAKHREWSSEIEARFANIRAQRAGEGRTLTPKEARGLAGEWYSWFVAREANRWPVDVLEDYHHRMLDELQAVAITCGVHSGEPLQLLESHPTIRERARPLIADESKTEQFLAAKRLALDLPSRVLFLDFVARDFFAALSLLARRARGDYGADKWAERFPRSEISVDSGLTPWTLFERWIAKAKPAISTVDRWRAVFQKLAADYPGSSAGALLPEQMREWANGLISEDRSAYTVSAVWVNAAKAVFGWAVEEKLISRNPFVGLKIKVPKRKKTRETKSFTGAETKTILAAALKIDVRSKTDAARRWGPWIAAYSGARMGEITQLRGVDIVLQDGIHAMKLSPEAGTVKTSDTRLVPLHEHIVAQGFLDFVKASGSGPLFYSDATPKRVSKDEPTNPAKPRAVKARERVANWVRDIGVDDPELQPNHAWRHTFKAMGDRCGIPEKVVDVICGHAPATTGRGYGAPTLVDKARELAKFPRYDVG